MAAVLIQTIVAEESMVEASATNEQCDSNGKDNATCTHEQQHSNDFTPSNSATSNTETKINHGSSMNSDHNNNNKKHDSQKDTTPFILPFP